MSVGYIYALSDPRNKFVPRYIGRTSQRLRQRLKGHRRMCRERPHYPISRWITELKSVGLEPTIYLLENVLDGNLKARETAWIRFFRPLGTLLNQSDGDGSLGLGNYWMVRPVESEDGSLWFPSITIGARAIGADAGTFQKSLIKGWRCRGVRWKYSERKIGVQPDALSILHIRSRPRTQHLRPTLTKSQQAEIGRLWDTGNLSQTQIGQRFGVTQSNVSRTIKRLTNKSNQ